MTVAEPRPGRAPPLGDLDDHGLRWRQVGSKLVMTRGLTGRAVLWPVAAALATLGIGIDLMSEGDWWVGGFMVGATILPGAFAWMRFVHRFELELSPDGLTWRQIKPRAFQGRIPGRHLDGVRLVIGRAMSGFHRNRSITVDLRCNGNWMHLAFGMNRRRGERLAHAISETRAWPLVVHDEDKDGALPR